MDFIEQLRAIVCGPQGLAIGALAVLLIQRFWPNLKLPNLPSPTPTPNPGPVPPPLPALPVIFPNPDGSPKFPTLRALLDAFLKLNGMPFMKVEDLPPKTIAALWDEVDALAGHKAEQAKADAKELE